MFVEVYRIDSVNGSDSNSGSPSSPWASLSKLTSGVMSGLSPGQFVGVARGSVFTVDAAVSIPAATGTAPLKIGSLVAVGTGAAPIIQTSDNTIAVLTVAGTHVVVQGIHVIGGLRGFTFGTGSNISFIDCETQDQDSAAGGDDPGVGFRGSASDNGSLINCWIHETDGDGFTEGGGDGWLLLGCLIENCGAGLTSILTDGAAFHGSLGAGNVVRRCIIHGIRGKAGISTAENGGDAGSVVLVDQCWIFDCWLTGVLADGSATVITVRNCVISVPTGALHQNLGGSCVGNVDSGEMIVQNCTLINECTAGTAGTNPGSAAGGVYCLANSSGTMTVRNCRVLCGTSKAGFWYHIIGTTHDYLYNCYYPDDTTADLASGRFVVDVAGTPTAVQFATWRDTGGLDGGPGTTESFASASETWTNPYDSAGQVDLDDASECVGAGENLYATFKGDYAGRRRAASGAWDIGAFTLGVDGGYGVAPASMSLTGVGG